MHSKGPWRIEGDRIKTAISSGYKHVAMVNYFNCGPGDLRSISDAEHEANSHLIASAPDMLEVLLWLNHEMVCRDNDYGGVMFTRNDFEKVCNVIKKATGN